MVLAPVALPPAPENPAPVASKTPPVVTPVGTPVLTSWPSQETSIPTQSLAPTYHSAPSAASDAIGIDDPTFDGEEGYPTSFPSSDKVKNSSSQSKNTKKKEKKTKSKGSNKSKNTKSAKKSHSLAPVATAFSSTPSVLSSHTEVPSSVVIIESPSFEPSLIETSVAPVAPVVPPVFTSWPSQRVTTPSLSLGPTYHPPSATSDAISVEDGEQEYATSVPSSGKSKSPQSKKKQSKSMGSSNKFKSKGRKSKNAKSSFPNRGKWKSSKSKEKQSKPKGSSSKSKSKSKGSNKSMDVESAKKNSR